jgi:glycosyltransferase involved in cell wall biosynthesis
VVGGGDDEPRLRAKARELGIDAAVRFLGRVTDAELADCYRRSAVLAMPSRQEGFGLVYAEAMWHGTPCIGSTADAARVVIRAGETGLLIPYGDVPALTDALCKLLGDPQLQGRFATAARRSAVERFGYERFRKDLLAALELDA